MSEPTEYERGVTAGGIEARLAGHDRHFNRINGSLDNVADELAKLVLVVQRLADGAVARDATVLVTASALKDAEEARRHSSERRWTPLARGLAVLGALVGLVGLVVTLLLLGR